MIAAHRGTIPACLPSGTTRSMKYFQEAQNKVHPTMNENLRNYYSKIQQHFKGGLPQKVQPPEYQ